MAWTIIESAPLNLEQMTGNAQEYANYFTDLGYTRGCISGQLGNIQAESTINPARWQSDVIGDYSAGFGLVQWTPATNYTNWATANGFAITDPIGQMIWIDTLSGKGQWYPTSAYPITWEEFKVSEESPEYLAKAFLYNFERPADPSATEQARATQARYWYDTLEWQGGNCFTTPRLTDSGIMNNPYWYSSNPFYQAGFGLPNCTCYAWGRWYEILSKEPVTSLGNADTWFEFAVNNRQKTGKTPELGALITFHYTGASSGDGGHVAVVEVINEDGSIVTSNSAYGGAYFYTQTLSPPDYSWGVNVVLDGFIYLACSKPPVPPKKKNKMPLWMYLFPI